VIVKPVDGRCDDPYKLGNRLHARCSIAAFYSCGETMCNERVTARQWRWLGSRAAKLFQETFREWMSTSSNCICHWPICDTVLIFHPLNLENLSASMAASLSVATNHPILKTFNLFPSGLLDLYFEWFANRSSVIAAFSK
jgi:hypothetical protein